LLTYSVPLFLTRRRDRNPQLLGLLPAERYVLRLRARPAANAPWSAWSDKSQPVPRRPSPASARHWPCLGDTLILYCH
jgi:hypothetical protein